VLTSCTGLPTAGLVDDAVTYAKMQNVSATARLLGRYTAAAGNVEEVPIQNANGLIAISTSGLGARWPFVLQFGCSSAASVSRFNLWTDRVVCTTTAGFRTPLAGRITWSTVMLNVSDAIDAAQTLTIETRINNSAQAALTLTILPADATGDIGKTVTGVTTITFAAGDFITSRSTLSGGTSTWDEVFHAIGCEFDVA
jgi:hypothetical protein